GHAPSGGCGDARRQEGGVDRGRRRGGADGGVQEGAEGRPQGGAQGGAERGRRGHRNSGYDVQVPTTQVSTGLRGAGRKVADSRPRAGNLSAGKLIERSFAWRLNLASLRRPSPANAYPAQTRGCAVPLVSVITVHGRRRIPMPHSEEGSEAMPAGGGCGRTSETIRRASDVDAGTRGESRMSLACLPCVSNEGIEESLSLPGFSLPVSPFEASTFFFFRRTISDLLSLR
ncbi:uncharacterized protein LOC103795607, partial [Callithrix jacchus]|uniref:uncharacterized protein LOC103795607 n=1 Tax=Callithrix jacchus TaxID=9483 RepID=UPI0004F0734C